MSAGPGTPPNPFDPLIETLPAGTVLWRVHDSRYAGDAFHPGGPSAKPSRFAFFGSPHAPVLCLGEGEECAIAETILHSKVSGSVFDSTEYVDKVLSRVTVGRELRLASFKGFGLPRLGATAGQLAASPSRHYGQTRAWAEAAHAVGVEGIVWMSARFNEQCAYMLFGDRVRGAHDLDAGAGAVKVYGAGTGLDRLIEICQTVQVRLRLPRNI